MSTLLSLLVDVDVYVTRMGNYTLREVNMNLLLKNEQTNRQH